MPDQLPSPDDPAAVDAAAGVAHRVLGTVMPVLQVDLRPGQSLVSPGGEVSWMTPSIALSTTTAGAGSKGMFGALKRAVAGGGLFLTEYTAENGPGTVSFAAKLPGEIRPVAIAADREYLVHRHGFLAGTAGVNLSIGFQQKLGAGIFGGSGFILERVTGQGTAWVALSGELVEYHLTPGENLRVIPGHVGLFDAGMDFSIQMVKGIRNMLFGADSLFLASLTGPGMVWLQTMPISQLANAIQPYLTTEEEGGKAGTAGAFIGSFIKS
ncbi:MAG TPA: TIGR00266 family protein [Acidimicrobiales bacterium]|nr:TIGR00266 family protein [Acidimicrobiales bacterium]